REGAAASGGPLGCGLGVEAFDRVVRRRRTRGEGLVRLDLVVAETEPELGGGSEQVVAVRGRKGDRRSSEGRGIARTSSTCARWQRGTLLTTDDRGAPRSGTQG